MLPHSVVLSKYAPSTEIKKRLLYKLSLHLISVVDLTQAPEDFQNMAELIESSG